MKGDTSYGQNRKQHTWLFPLLVMRNRQPPLCIDSSHALGLGGSVNRQFMMRYSSNMVTWEPIAKHSVSEKALEEATRRAISQKESSYL